MSQNGKLVSMEVMEYTELSIEERKHILKGLIRDAERQHFEAMCNVNSVPQGARTPHEQKAQTIAQALQKLKQQLADLDRLGGK